ncbi:hypothetical protein CLG96_17645 [Sphingomonas oleivorans]|uniref:TonB C-terminal domain-containing protein n=1 Tax=Sphingomonas oleivorans TaxID=1735121 RepID=A0A2T5FTH3_9SPHN|nr:hypothetical protein [Sphingomonas oleivorans]PTQ07371.1 hypothetical protein CLG96_17645 [Sphingomonas oleivorans]
MMELMAAMMLAAGTPAGPTVQQLFDTATAAFDRQDLPEALAGYEAIEKKLGPNGSRRSLALARARKGRVLVALRRDAEAAIVLRLAVEGLPAGDANLREDRFFALFNLGAIAERALDYAAARRDYAEARATTDDIPLRLGADGGLIRTTMFDDPAAAVALADRALTDVATLQGETKDVRARLRTLRGRALLQKGELPAARAELQRAMQELGGLTLKVDSGDIAARSDLAIAAMLAGDPDDARRYLAYTGAGRLKDGGLMPAVDNALPSCGGPDGLRPDDVAVIEFSISDDGGVGHVAPIYASRSGPVALAFARAVADWSWTPDKVKDIPPLFRAMTRLELRCSTSSQRPDIAALLGNGLESWLAARGVAPVEDGAGSSARDVARLRSELASREALSGPNSPALVPVLWVLAVNPVIPFDERLLLAERMRTILETGNAPGGARAAVTILAANSARRASRYGRGRTTAEFLSRLGRALEDPAIASDAAGSAAIRLLIVDRLAEDRKYDAAKEGLGVVIGDGRLGPRDPFRVAALMRLASVELARKDMVAARSAYERTGLSAQECALVDAKPSLRRTNASSADFPDEALRWGFAGWAKTEFDIAANGRTIGARTVIAYPPFIFGAAAQKMLGNAIYEQSYRPQGALGCGGQQVGVRFSLPDWMR